MDDARERASILALAFRRSIERLSESSHCPEGLPPFLIGFEQAPPGPAVLADADECRVRARRPRVNKQVCRNVLVGQDERVIRDLSQDYRAQ